MKNILFLLVFILSATMLFGQGNPTGTSNEMDTAAMAKIYMIRSTGYVGAAVNLRLLVDNVMMCKVKNNHFAILYVKPGTHIFHASSWDKPEPKEKLGFTLSVEAGKEYYFSMRIKSKFAGIEIYLEEITYNTAAQQLQKYKQDKCD